MLILNLGCGTKTGTHPAVVNLDHSIYRRIRRYPLLRLGPLVVRGERRASLRRLPDNIRADDLRHGLPYPAASADVVYHAHLLEHLNRDAAAALLREGWRVLRPGGIQRIVVRDLGLLCRRHLASREDSLHQPAASTGHERPITDLLEQSARLEAFGSSRQAPWPRRLEGFLLGDARRRGETHQWIDDRVRLPRLLSQSAFREVRVQRFDASRIPAWRDYGLYFNDEGGEYRPGSLYVEARR